MIFLKFKTIFLEILTWLRKNCVIFGFKASKPFKISREFPDDFLAVDQWNHCKISWKVISHSKLKKLRDAAKKILRRKILTHLHP